MNERTDMIGLGSRVKVRGLDGLAEFSVVEPGEADAADKRVSAASPLGRALLGHQVGDEVQFRAPAGVQAVTVLEVNG